jgi:hypothetical protein
MKDGNPIRTARRKANREERLGKNAFCMLCGYACLESLTQVSQQWLEAKGIPTDRIACILEEHHVVGEAHDAHLTITLCLNCHREITEGLAREGISMRPEANRRNFIAMMLRASAVLFEALAESYRKWANLLESENENK